MSSERWHHRLGGLDVEEQVGARQIAGTVGDAAAQRQPIAHCEPAVLAQWIARVVCRDCVFLAKARRVDEILEKQDVLLRFRDRQTGFRKQHAGVVHPLLAMEPREVVEGFGTLRALIEGSKRLANEACVVPELS
ncbi:hypothetical protein [Mesorhizobium sp. M1A.F.Ca.ET.072.01.1.1]|uniref:hypothetical protein n=1 Tax=Mesorhizobium sp. M1A.F.Ca.ET.072.01.1.1 TaxID=2496753 RepID=UPI001672AB17|nr:hypothetical protein [Mesorhizobium sp. M1A.F.Ca.ET.072.01.1.1]